ncbi:MAG: hypothetical protein KDC49_14080 [Saprospiraceae bacterium]|nr:hypothetical protein [Saprospiraceae bacterium]
MKLNNIISKVKSIKIKNDFVFSVKNDNSLVLNEIVLDVHVEAQSLNLIHSFYLIYRNLNELSFIYDINKNSIIDFNKNHPILYLILKNTWLTTFDFKYTNELSWKVGLFNPLIQKNPVEIMELQNKSVNYLSEELLFASDKNSISCYNLIDCKIDWLVENKFNIEYRIIGIFKSQIIIILGTKYIYSLDKNSGKILWELPDWEKDFIFFNEKHKWYNATHNMFIEDGKIYNMSGALYYSIDLETRAVEILWHDERPVDHYFIKYFTYDRDYIYFAGGINISIQANKIGIFNRKTLQVECISDDDLGIDPLHGYAASYNQAPQYGGGKLYGLDTAGNLRIYQVDLS